MTRSEVDYSRYTILVVEDEPELAELLEEIIEDFGYKVLTANGGIEALEIIKSSHVDLVLSDIKMPDGDGVTLLVEAQKLDPAVPVFLMMTGYADYTEKELIALGATLLIGKPIKIPQLEKTIAEMLKLT